MNTPLPELRRTAARSTIAVLLAGCILNAPALAADSLKSAAEDAANCRELRNPDVRLACFDAAAVRLAEALDPTGSLSQSSPELPTPADTANAAAIAQAPSAEEIAEVPNVSETSTTPAAVEPPVAVAEQSPEWAAAPARPPEKEEKKIPREFEATIVRITVNNVGRHRFYTADGAVWEQTQLVDVQQPESLPAVAQFRRRWSGNPTIKFDVSNRSYRVRRIK